MISRVGDVEVAVVVEGESCGVVELCDGSRAVFVGGRAVTCEGRHVAEGIDFADAVVVFVGDVEVAVVVKGESARGGESGLLACSVGKAFGVGADKSADAPVFFDLSDAMVPFVGDVKVVLAIEGKGAWGVECGVEFSVGVAAAVMSAPFEEIALRADSKDAVGLDVGDKKAAKAIDGEGSRAQEFFVGGMGDLAVYRGGCAVRSDFSDGVVGAIGDVEVAVSIEGDLGGVVELCVGSGSVLPTAPVACEGDGSSVRADLSDGVIACIRDVKIAAAVEDHALWRPELRSKGDSVDSALDTASSEGADLSIRKSQAAQDIVSAICGDQEAHIGGYRDATEVLELGLAEWAVFATESKGGESGHRPIGCDAPQ
jgi:hypothetical protein